MDEDKKLERQIAKVFNNKSLHIELTGLMHKRLRVMLFLHELTMQRFFRLMAEKFIEGDEHLIQLVEEKANEIKERKINNLKEISEKDLYNAIEENSPLEDNS